MKAIRSAEFDVDWDEDVVRSHARPGVYTDQAGALELKTRIEAYWRKRGYEVHVNLVQAPFTPALRTARVDLRSEMVDGMPRGCCGKKLKPPAED